MQSKLHTFSWADNLSDQDKDRLQKLEIIRKQIDYAHRKNT